MIFNNNFILNNQGVSNSFDTIDMPRHRWYYYKEGFSPNLIEKAIEYADIKKTDIILDPFNGGGTTTLTAAINGYQSYGIEVNPFTAFLSDVKIQNVNQAEYDRISEYIFNCIRKGDHSELNGFSSFTQSHNNSKWLFNDDVLAAFSGGWNITKNIKSIELRKIIQLALITSAMKNCNATRDGKCLRYRSSWETYNYSKNTFLSVFQNNMDMIIQDIQSLPLNIKPDIINGDARLLLQKNTFSKFRLCITSPPYLNTFDYTDIYRPELFLGEFVKSKPELYDLRLKTVRSHIQAKWKMPKLSDFGEVYNTAIKHIIEHEDELMSKRIPIMVQAYFEDMLNVLKLLRNNAEKNAQIWFVVSNSAYADREIPVDLIIADIAGLAGWKLKEVGVLRNIRRRKTKYSPNIDTLRESVIILYLKD